MRWRGLNNSVRVLLLAACSFPALADTQPAVLIVELTFNGQPYGEDFVLADDAGNFYVEQSTLRNWDVIVPFPPGVEYGGKTYYPLSGFYGATASLNSAELVLDVTMPPRLLPTRVVNMTDEASTAVTASNGAYMDYDWTLRKVPGNGQLAFSGLLQPVVFGPRGNIEARLLYRHTSGSELTRFDRQTDGLDVLDLTYTRDDPANVRSLRIGDVISAGGTMGRSVRLGGVQFATNFATRPTLITYPLPSFYGEASVPTALDVYVNGQLHRRERVAPGSYILEDIPVINGAGQMQIVTEDALGRQQTFVQDFYVSPDLLRSGLNDYSFDLGKLREDYGLDSFHYGGMAGSATWRHGLRDYLTVEGHTEFTGDLAVVSGGTQYQPVDGGVLSGGLGLSSGSGGTGAQWMFGYRQANSMLSYNLRYSGNSRKFDSVGDATSLPSRELFISAGFGATVRGSLGAALTHQSYRDQPARSIISANYSTSFTNGLSLAAVASVIRAGKNDFVLGLRFSLPFGNDHLASGGFSTGGDATQLQLEARRNVPVGPGIGYHVSLNKAGETFGSAGAIAQNEFGTVSANIRSSAAGAEWELGSSGAVATLGGMTRVTREIRDAFAVVDVGDYEGVRVYAENREVGRTDARGQVFVPNLRPYQRNQISIEVDDLPLNARVGELHSDTSPYLRSGVVVEFDVTEARDAMIHVVLPDGTPVRQGAVGRVFGQKDWSPIGTEGRLYLHGLVQPSQVTVRWNGSVCDFVVPKPEVNGTIPDLGQFTCEPRIFQ